MPCIWYASDENDTAFRADTAGNVDKSFATPDTYARGMGYNPEGSLWYTGDITEGIQLLNQSGSVVSTFASPSSDPWGISENADDCLWNTDSNANTMYKVSPATGSVVLSLSTFDDLEGGIVEDTGTCIWVTDSANRTRAKITQFDQSGSQTGTSFSTNNSEGRVGMGIDAEDSLWIADRPEITKYNHSGSILQSFYATSMRFGPVTTTAEPVGGPITDFAVPTDVGFSLTQTAETGTGTVPATKTAMGFDETEAPLGGTGTVTTVTTPMAFAPVQGAEALVGTAEAITEAFSHRVKAGQPARLWWDTPSQWESPQKSGNVQVTDGDEIGPVSGSGYIIPTDQNWEGDN